MDDSRTVSFGRVLRHFNTVNALIEAFRSLQHTKGEGNNRRPPSSQFGSQGLSVSVEKCLVLEDAFAHAPIP